MSIALTFFKKRGSKEADEFRGVTGFRGSPLNEWDYLSLDPQLREIGVNLIVREYAEAAELNEPYNTLVKKPICLDLRCGSEKSDQYPDKAELTATAIKAWVLSVLKSKRPDTLSSAVVENEVERTEAAPASTVSTTPSGASSGATDKPTEVGDVDDRGVWSLGFGLAGTLLVAAMAVAGAVGGSILADREDEDDGIVSTEIGDDGRIDLCLVAEDTEDEGKAQKLDFKKIAKAERDAQKKGNGRNPWEEAPPRPPSVPDAQIQGTGNSNNVEDPTAGF